ncbi:MAG: glucose-6-phosphate isomerase [Planctomycetota bacterium]|jgi:glucose-6-phosphate isomerase
MGLVLETADLAGTGLEERDLRAWQEAAGRAAAALPRVGFSAALDRAPAPLAAAAGARVVVLGIGGSALGARAVHEACGGTGKPLVVVDNVDPELLEATWAAGAPEETAWVVVSKSGGTTETLAQWAVVRERLRAAGRAGEVHVVTGADGPLRAQAAADGLPVHEIPEDVGGRFSIFTPAGTVPLALAGHDVAALLAGARAARDHCARADGAASRLAALLVAAAQAGRNVVTMWAYAERLAAVGEWFRQLWAESLGKARADGTRVGQSPLHCVGSTDQHSIQQLMVEGPPDKAVLVIAGPGVRDVTVPPGGPGAGHTFDAILQAMRRATTAAMVQAGCPAATIRLDDWSEHSVGGLLMVLLCATVVAGRLQEVDPFGQPGVEAAKVAALELLAEPGGRRDRETARLLGEGVGIRCP